MSPRSAARRLGAAAVAGALLGLAAPSAAWGQSFLNAADPCPEPAPAAGFSDRESIAPVHRLNVDCAADQAIAFGKAGNVFDPGGTVTRGQMASFIVRTLVAGGYTLPAPSDQGFTDVKGNTHQDAINQLAAIDVTLGVTPTTYRPNDPVRRDQMASFVVRAAEFAYEDDVLVGEAVGPFPFTDVPASNVHRGAIAAAAELLGVSEGTSATTYAPSGTTTRAQMATFVVRLLDVTLVPEP